MSYVEKPLRCTLRESHQKMDRKIRNERIEMRQVDGKYEKVSSSDIFIIIFMLAAATVTRHWQRWRQADNLCCLFKINQCCYVFCSFSICLHLIGRFWGMGDTTCVVACQNYSIIFLLLANWVGEQHKQSKTRRNKNTDWVRVRLFEVLYFALCKYK